ncbi:MAG: NUDIX hydrolase [Desulfurococcales archaeon]|nr:NUDIX hydrolase [Desulfurococcales archaeon]
MPRGEHRPLRVLVSFKKYEARVEEAELPGRGRMHVFRVAAPDSVAILPYFTSTGEVVLLRQYRPAVGSWIYEAPAGTIAPGESPEETAARELEEEAGLRPGRLELAARGYLTPGYSSEYMYLYIAWDPEPGRMAHEEDEVIEVRRVSLAEALGMVERGDIGDVKTALLLYALARKLGV